MKEDNSSWRDLLLPFFVYVLSNKGSKDWWILMGFIALQIALVLTIIVAIIIGYMGS